MTLGHTSDFQPMTLLSVLTVLDIWSQLTFLVKTEIWRKKKKSKITTTTTVWINYFLCCLITNILAEECFIIVFHSLKFMLCLSISDFLSMACDSPYGYPQWCALFSVLFLKFLLLKRFNNNNSHFYLQLVKIFPHPGNQCSVSCYSCLCHFLARLQPYHM